METTHAVNRISEKLSFFEYALNGFYSWYGDAKSLSGAHTSQNDISVLKSMKLLFFLTAESTVVSEKRVLSTGIFSDFHALPYGPVESELYNEVRDRKGMLDYFEINSNGLTRKAGVDLEELISSVKAISLDAKTELDDALKSLKEKNNELILMPPFDLVDLSHQWFSWRKNITFARYRGANSHPILPEDIESDAKKYILSVF